MFQYANKVAEAGLLFSFLSIILASVSEVIVPPNSGKSNVSLKVVVSCAALAVVCIWIIKAF